MRGARIKVDARGGAAVYHCISRTVNGEWLFDDEAKEVFRKQMWQVAEYCGIQILTYAFLSNHFHILIRVPKHITPTDAELLRRYKVLYPQPSKFQVAQITALERRLAIAGDQQAQAWRERQMALMGDVSPFMKLLKQRFTIWFNRRHGRFGTIWAERFKSVLVETSQVLKVVAAYIDLNSVRAGLVKDPKEYRFSGYAEAVAGKRQLRLSLAMMLEQRNWQTTLVEYQQLLYGRQARKKADGEYRVLSKKTRGITHDVWRTGLSATLRRHRIRYFTDGAVLGSKEFVMRLLASSQQIRRERKFAKPFLLPAKDGWSGLAVLHRLRNRSG